MREGGGEGEGGGGDEGRREAEGEGEGGRAEGQRAVVAVAQGNTGPAQGGGAAAERAL